MNKAISLGLALVASSISVPSHGQTNDAMCVGLAEAAKLPPEQDAVAAAPNNHRVIFENDDMRVLDVLVRPGEREVLHYHRWPSVFVVDALPKFETRGADGNEIPEAQPAPQDPQMPLVLRVPPQLMVHSIHNIDNKPFHAIRIEYKTLCAAK